MYDALCVRASLLVARGKGSLSPESLVHDVLVKLFRSESQNWRDEVHFRATAALAMRQILADRARKSRTARHGHCLASVSLSGLSDPKEIVDAFALKEALDALEPVHPRAVTVFVYRLFGGLKWSEVADALGCSESTVKREWRIGQAWVRMRLAA